MAESRLSRMPIQYILGEWDFLELTLKMKAPVFIPRPETEDLVLLASSLAPKALKCLEIGVGTGAISLALLNRNKEVGSVSLIFIVIITLLKKEQFLLLY